MCCIVAHNIARRDAQRLFLRIRILPHVFLLPLRPKFCPLHVPQMRINTRKPLRHTCRNGIVEKGRIPC